MNEQMIKPNYELREMARNQLSGQWGTAVLLYLVYIAVTMVVGLISREIASIVNVIIAGPLTLGFVGCFLTLIRGGELRFESLFDGFKNFLSAFLTYLLTVIFVILWSLIGIIPAILIIVVSRSIGLFWLYILGFIPGIIASYRYMMAFYILHDNPDISALEAIRESKKMMYGYKGKLFMLHLSFIGWGILTALTFGIGSLWLVPYIQTSVANFYQNLKDAQGNNINTDNTYMDNIEV